MGDLSNAEAQVYDRQLRVWGVEVQKRLQGAKVLIIGTGGLAAEVAKNIVLAGVGSVSLADDTLVGQKWPGSFLVPADAESEESVASTSAAALSEMNPLVAVNSRTMESISCVQDVKEFSVVVLIGGSYADQLKFNKWCRSQDVKFYAGKVVGGFAHFFADLHTHTYCPKGASADAGSSGYTISYVPLEKAFTSPTLPKKAHALFFILQAFEEENRHPPSAKDVDRVVEIAERRLHSEKMGGRSLDKGFLQSYVSSSVELAPVCAIVGGVLGNEVVKAVGVSSEPLRNFFFYSIKDGKGSVEFFGV